MPITDPAEPVPGPERPHHRARPPRRLFTWRLFTWILSSLLVAATAGVAALPRLLGTPARITAGVAALVPQLAADVVPGRVRLGWLGPIVLDDVVVVPRDGGPRPLVVRRLELERGLAGIILSAGDVGRVRIEGLEADVVFDRDHRSNVESLMPRPPDGASTAGGGPRRTRISMRLEIDDAVVRITGPWTHEPWVSDPISLRASLGNTADGHAAWTVEPVQLLERAELRQAVAHEVLAYVVPVFADAARTSGRFSLRIDGGTFPVGQPEKARLAGLLQMHAVELGPGPLVENTLRSLPFSLPPPPTLKIADEADVRFRLEDRRVWHDGVEFGVPLRRPGQRLDVRSRGSVGLDDRSLDLELSLPIPADLPQDKPLVAALAGKRISLGVGGVLGDPKVIFDGSIKEAAGQVVVDLIDRLRNGPRPQSIPPAPVRDPEAADAAGSAVDGDAAAAGPQQGRAEEAPADGGPPRAGGDRGTAAQGGAAPDTAEAIVDIVGGVLDEVARRRAERRAAEAANPGQPAPRRGRLFQRRQPPPLQPSQVQPPPDAPAAP